MKDLFKVTSDPVMKRILKAGIISLFFGIIEVYIGVHGDFGLAFHSIRLHYPFEMIAIYYVGCLFAYAPSFENPVHKKVPIPTYVLPFLIPSLLTPTLRILRLGFRNFGTTVWWGIMGLPYVLGYIIEKRRLKNEVA